MEKGGSSSDSRRNTGPTPISALIDPLIAPVFKKRGFYQHKLLNDWPLIVGNLLASCTVPQKIVSRKVQETNQGVLYIDVANGSVGVQLQFMEPIILEKIAVYFGFRAVTSLKIRQKPFATIQKATPPSILLSTEENQLLATLTSDITDEALQQSLQELGKLILKNPPK